MKRQKQERRETKVINERIDEETETGKKED
jgi:hypothetical protein